MILLGCKPPGRKTEQHDIFFGIGENLKGLLPEMIQSWEGSGVIHIDAWREVNFANGYEIHIIDRQKHQPATLSENNNVPARIKLFFINLGGYKQNEFEEFHYKMIIASENKSFAIRQAKSSTFYRHTGFKGATSHIDDKYGVDVDDIYEIEDILPQALKEKYHIQILPADISAEDELHLGYLMLNKL